MKKSPDSINNACINNHSLINKDVRINAEEERKRNITFSFAKFYTASIKYSTFNNYFESRKEALLSTINLVSTIKDLSGITLNEIETNTRLKDKYRYHRIDDGKEIRKIDYILKNGYSANEAFVDQLEDDYYQFEYGPNGNRIIITRVGATFLPLFIDNNHLIYEKQSIDSEKKMMYKVPSAIDKEFIKKKCDIEEFELSKILIEDLKTGKIKTIKEFIRQWDTCFNS